MQTWNNKQIIKMLILWAHNEDLSLKIIDKWLLKEAQGRLKKMTPPYIEAIHTDQLSEEITSEQVQAIIDFNIDEIEDTDLQEVIDSIEFYCASCDISVFSDLNKGYHNTLCRSCEEETFWD